ncbi:hypothetical protein [Anaerolentibacter hominis]|uniref:hypothetical protein n=1 Tax=Anaerolentibacter hominis TaxID=3079009 RepID=UPI0031B8A304
MNAIIRQGNGEYYCSAVFGCYDDGKEAYSYGMYYIVLNQNKTKLVKQPLFHPDRSQSLDKMVLIFDGDQTNWVVDEKGFGGVDFLPKEESLRIVDTGRIDDDLLNKCLQMDSSVQFSEYNEIKTEQDMERFMMVTGGFHDAVISKLEQKQDGSVSVSFDGIWGCSVEIYFQGDVTYCTESRNPALHDPYWFDASVLMENGYFIFVDEENVSADVINDNYCWFRAKSMAYHLIPE